MEKRVTEALVELLEQDVLCESGLMKKIDKKSILTSLLADRIEVVRDEGNRFLDQGKTGYCWLVSALFCVSCYVENKTKIKQPVYSKSYLIFYDKLEKANKFLTLIIETGSESLDEKKIRYLLDNAMTDRGQWSMAENLITKYGLIPYETMPDEASEVSTGELNACISFLLRYFAMEIRQIYNTNSASVSLLQEKRKAALSKVYQLLIVYYGKPPKLIRVPWEYADEEIELSPYDFYKSYIDFPFDDYISVCSIKNEDYVNYITELDGNVVEGRKNTFFNLPDEEFTNAVLEQIRLEHFCWAACDTGKFNIACNLLFDDELFDLAILTGNNGYRTMCRAELYQYHIASFAHSVVLREERYQGNEKYLIAYNSALSNRGMQYCRISESWFCKYIFQAVVRKQFLGDNLTAVLRNTRKIMPWDFFG